MNETRGLISWHRTCHRPLRNALFGEGVLSMLIFSKMKFPLAHTIAISLVVLLIAVCAPIVNAQTTLAAQLISRPVTNDDINGLKLPATVERSGGLNTVGLGQAAYLEADVDITVPASQIAGVKWTIESQPTGSKAGLGDSPLGATVPAHRSSERLIYQIGRESC